MSALWLLTGPVVAEPLTVENVDIVFPDPDAHPLIQPKGRANHYRLMLIGSGEHMDRILEVVESMRDMAPWNSIGLPEVICVNFDDFDVLYGDYANGGYPMTWARVLVHDGVVNQNAHRAHRVYWIARDAYNHRVWPSSWDWKQLFDVFSANWTRQLTDFVIWYHPGEDGGRLNRQESSYQETLLPIYHDEAATMLSKALREWIVEAGIPETFDHLHSEVNRELNVTHYQDKDLFTDDKVFQAIRQPGEAFNARNNPSFLYPITPAVVDGDLNFDGVVDTADLGRLIQDFGSTGPVCDLNYNGFVDTSDLGILLSEMR